ncbi:MAG: outer membrane protein assembly factor BamD [Bacteroidetes bacterium]|nr:outer membrane protein assembly factor BamD [Bacteroidota bacterium]MDA0973318.1 outer membrane protein assembly factor BamD [Bacteroidota bacterium]
MKKYLFFTLCLVGLSSCSEFSKIQKENDLEKKFAKAVEYYNEGECLKSSILFEELISLVRGTSRGEEVYYYHAKSTYCDEDYILGSYYFKNFVKTFPNSQYAEECSYLGAYCLYLESPNYSLDQSDTRTAIAEMQLHLDRFPNTTKKDTINTLIRELREKLEVKEFEHARLYYRTKRYKSAVIALQNALKEYPDSRFREDMLFFIVESNYELAINSIESKKEERLLDTIESYHTFADAYGESPKLRQAEQWYGNAVAELERMKSTKSISKDGY